MSDPGTGIGGSGGPPPVGRAVPVNADFYRKWGEENAKDSIKTANAALAQLLTLSTALLGGSIALWNVLPVASAVRVAFIIVMLFTVIICLFSAVPRTGVMDLTSASDIRDHMEDLIAAKCSRISRARWSLTVALTVIILGLLEDQTLVGARLWHILRCGTRAGT